MINKEQKQRIKDLVDQFSRIVNNFDDKVEYSTIFTEEFLNSHKTLQQSMMGVMINFLLQYSQTQFFDLRNEFSVKVAKVTKEALEKEDWVVNNVIHFPYI